MLTRKQHELLLYIHKELQAKGISPSFDEMKEALDLKSKSGIHRLITALEERGFIRRLAHRARALEVLRLPESSTVAPSARGNVTQLRPTREAAPEPPAGDDAVANLPLYGRIAAGLPNLAVADASNSIDVPQSMLGRGEHFALEVTGDSMIEAGILDGDVAICRRCETAENGSIVVALVDQEEATLKRLRRRGNSVALEPANPKFETRIFPPDRVTIQGRLIGLYRRYE